MKENLWGLELFISLRKFYLQCRKNVTEPNLDLTANDLKLYRHLLCAKSLLVVTIILIKWTQVYKDLYVTKHNVWKKSILVLFNYLLKHRNQLSFGENETKGNAKTLFLSLLIYFAWPSDSPRSPWRLFPFKAITRTWFLWRTWLP